MKTPNSGALMCAFLFASTLSIFAQGSLTPPGAPSPTMKTLDEVEPRTPISSVPFTISSSGSYYLTRSLTAAASTTAITVDADNVSIDLRGHILSGTNATAVGINVPSNRSNLVVENGILRSFTTGVNAPGVDGARLERLTVSDCGGGAFGSASLGAGFNSIFRDCVVIRHNGGNPSAGFNVGFNAVVENCSASQGSGSAHGFLSTSFSNFSHCSANSNAGDGFSVGIGSIFRSCASSQNFGSGFSATSGARFESCDSYNNIGNGIVGSNDCAVTNCVVRGSGGTAGISCGDGSSLVNCVSSGNTNATAQSGGFVVGNGCSVIGCVAKANTNTNGTGTAFTGYGITTGSDCTVKDCTVQGNKGDGIQASSGSEIVNCTSNGNGNGVNGSGIIGAVRMLVRNCTVVDNRKNGIAVSGDSVVLENHASHNGQGASAAGIDTTLNSGTNSRIEGNRARDNVGTGILGSSSDVIIRNFSTGSATNYNPASGANFGPIELPSTSTHPSANF
jgi:hypothetical protein